VIGTATTSSICGTMLTNETPLEAAQRNNHAAVIEHGIS